MRVKVFIQMTCMCIFEINFTVTIVWYTRETGDINYGMQQGEGGSQHLCYNLLNIALIFLLWKVKGVEF